MIKAIDHTNAEKSHFITQEESLLTTHLIYSSLPLLTHTLPAPQRARDEASAGGATGMVAT